MHDMMKRYYRAQGVRIPDNDNDTPAVQRIVAEQAAFHGMTIERHKRFLDEICDAQERAEFEQWEVTAT